jgi:hypothetical protein
MPCSRALARFAASPAFSMIPAELVAFLKRSRQSYTFAVAVQRQKDR